MYYKVKSLASIFMPFRLLEVVKFEIFTGKEVAFFVFMKLGQPSYVCEFKKRTMVLTALGYDCKLNMCG